MASYVLPRRYVEMLAESRVGGANRRLSRRP
jgi:hypothetical protein